MRNYDTFTEFVLDQLSGLGAVECRAMFGGSGLYWQTRFFGIIYEGRLYFKTTAQTRAEYVQHGMGPFRPNAKQTLWSYYEVPVEIIEDADQLITWAQGAAASN
jgi:DNA transformation protein